jgi:hypothetical protein
VVGESETVIAFTWTPVIPGPHRLFAVSDCDNAVNEFDEGNNQTWRDVYVGFADPLLLDSGGNSDPQYTQNRGYGYLDGHASAFCGTDPSQTWRFDADGEVQYQLHLTFYQGAGGTVRQTVAVDSVDTGAAVELNGAQRVDQTVDVPAGIYAHG